MSILQLFCIAVGALTGVGLAGLPDMRDRNASHVFIWITGFAIGTLLVLLAISATMTAFPLILGLTVGAGVIAGVLFRSFRTESSTEQPETMSPTSGSTSAKQRTESVSTSSKAA